jgi:hypothetical protein
VKKVVGVFVAVFRAPLQLVSWGVYPVDRHIRMLFTLF